MNKNFKYLEKILIPDNCSINDVINIFNKTSPITGGKGFGIIIKKEKCVGIITDGDIRRLISKKFDLNNKLYKLKEKKFFYFNYSYSELDLINWFEKNDSPILILDKKKRPYDLIFKDNILNQHQSSDIEYNLKVPLRLSFAGGGYDFTDQILKTSLSIFSTNIKKYIFTKLIIRSDKKILINNLVLKKKYQYKSYQDINISKKEDLILNCILYLKPSFGFELTLYSDVDTNSGLGSSSIIVFSILKILFSASNKMYSNMDIAKLSYKIERLFFNLKGGWQDQLSVVKPGFKIIKLNNKDIDITTIQPTKKFLRKLEENSLLVKFNNKRKDPKSQNIFNNIQTKEFIKKVNSKTNQLLDSFIHEDYKAFNKIMLEMWKLKAKNNGFKKNQRVKTILKKLDQLNIDSFKFLGASGSTYLFILADRYSHREILRVLKPDIISSESLFYELDEYNVTKKFINKEK